MQYIQQPQEPRGARGVLAAAARQVQVCGQRGRGVHGGGRQGAKSRSRRHGRRRKSTRLARTTKVAIDRDLAREEAEVAKYQKTWGRSSASAPHGLRGAQAAEVYDNMQHALDHGCKVTRFPHQNCRRALRPATCTASAAEGEMVHCFGKIRVQRKLTSWRRQKEDGSDRGAALDAVPLEARDRGVDAPETRGVP